MYSLLYSTAGVLLLSQAQALVPRANLPPQFTVGSIGQQSSNIANVYRDGGSGGTINGLNLITFSDTTTTSGGTSGSMIGFTDNTIAYMGQNGAAINKLTDFSDSNSKVPRMPIPFMPNETQFTTDHFGKDGRRCVLWPQGSIAPVGDGKSGLAVYPVAIYGAGGGDLYSTLVTVTADAATGPRVERTVPQLFFKSDGPLYGVFGTIAAHEDPTSLYLFANDFDDKTLAGGLRVAKVAAAKAKDRTAYTYWDGSKWTPDMKAASAAKAGLLFDAKLSGGDLFWNDYYKTYMVVYFNGWADSTFYLRYSLDGKVTGKWSDEVKLYATQPDPSNKNEPYNYAGHAYPSLDKSGRTLTLSYTKSGGALTDMLKVTFK